MKVLRRALREIREGESTWMPERGTCQGKRGKGPEAPREERTSGWCGWSRVGEGQSEEVF